MFRIDKSFTRTNVAKAIRFTEELDAKLTVLANGEQISFNELVLHCCQYALDEYNGNVDANGSMFNSNFALIRPVPSHVDTENSRITI